MRYRQNTRKGDGGGKGSWEIKGGGGGGGKGGTGDKGGGKNDGKGGKGGKNKHLKRAPTHRPWQSEGIQISIGPGPGKMTRREIKFWLTFHVTPETIPIQHGATWERHRTATGEYPDFSGRNLDGVSFSGRLEPPMMYVPKKGLIGPDGDHTRFDEGVVSEERARKLLNSAWVTSGRPPDPGPDYVVMEDGAYAGPRYYLEPHAFKERLERATKRGEVMRLVIGDNFGWNKHAFIEDFSWRFEDPDPDVLLYDITFTEWRAHDQVKGSKSQREDPKELKYTTKKGDTLSKISKKMWGVEFKWRDIWELNKQRIGKLWWYPDENTDEAATGKPKGWRDRGSIGRKIGGRTGFQLGKDNRIPADLEFRAGIQLRIDHKDKDDKKDEDDKKAGDGKKDGKGGKGKGGKGGKGR
jgi:hypothetical protein